LNGGPSSLNINSIRKIQNLLMVNVNNATYDSTENISDLVIINSVLTNPNQTTNPTIIENSLIYSGSTNINIKTSGWLNQDTKGFSNAKSTLSGQFFDGDFVKIQDYYFTDDREFLWIVCERPIMDLSPLQFIFLRGFSGNKARVIGSSSSKAFRIQEINFNKIKVKNPFRFYDSDNVLNDSLYRRVFNSSELVLYQQNMMIESGGTFTFDYAYASNSAWNGGEYTGTLTNVGVNEFKSVFNGGVFNANNITTRFDGEWFSRPESYHWTGIIQSQIEQDGPNFKFIIDLEENDIDFDNNDLVYVEFKETLPEPFYSRVENLQVSNVYPIFFAEGNYNVTITRYRVPDSNDNNNQLILDHNLNIGPESSKDYHTIIDQNIFNYLQDNRVINFNGLLSYNITYGINNLIGQDIIFDLYVNPAGISPGNESIVLGFQMTNNTSYILSITDVEIKITKEDLNTLDTAVARISSVFSWNHLYFEYIFETNRLKLVHQQNNIVIIDCTDMSIIGINGSNWTVSSTGNTTLRLNKSYIQSLFIGQDPVSGIISDAGFVDHIRFWNRPLTDGIFYLGDNPEFNNEIDFVKDVKYISKDLSDISFKTTFDDRNNEFLAAVVNNFFVLTEFEYINGIELPDDFVVAIQCSIEAMANEGELLSFDSNSTNYLLRVAVNQTTQNYDLYFDGILGSTSANYITSVKPSQKFTIYIANDICVINNVSALVDLNNPSTFNIGNLFGSSHVNTTYHYDNVVVMVGDVTEIISKLSENNTQGLVVDKVVNIDNYFLYSSENSIYPKLSNYAIIEESTNITDPGSGIIINPVIPTGWKYYKGDSIRTARLSDISGTSLQLYAAGNTSGNLDYNVAQIFKLDDYGEPIWPIESVSWRSKFNNGNFRAETWRAGIMNGGIVNNTRLNSDNSEYRQRFIWKWGINNGGIITNGENL
jgi:hypothetical protein